jgi:hypothetical protein
MIINIDVDPIAIPVMKSAEELANEEIKVIRD